MEDKVRTKKMHRLSMVDRKNVEICGVLDVLTFDLNKVIMETDFGVITFKGNNLHVSRLSLEKGEVDIDGKIDSVTYTETGSFSGKNGKLLDRFLK